jgi:hypothetical protein
MRVRALCLYVRTLAFSTRKLDRSVSARAGNLFLVRNVAPQGRHLAANGAQVAADYASPRLVSLRENLGLIHSQIRQVGVRGELL